MMPLHETPQEALRRWLNENLKQQRHAQQRLDRHKKTVRRWLRMAEEEFILMMNASNEAFNERLWRRKRQALDDEFIFFFLLFLARMAAADREPQNRQEQGQMPLQQMIDSLYPRRNKATAGKTCIKATSRPRMTHRAQRG